MTTINEKASIKPFHLDTFASAHMCPYLDRFDALTVHGGFVTSSSGQNMAIEGIGTVALRCELSDGTISVCKITDVLYVPNLTCPLLSWHKLRIQGYQMYDNGSVMRLLKGSKSILEAKFVGSLPVVSELHQPAIHNAFMTYEFWHQALCHAAPASIVKTGKLIQESNLIPDCPQDFHCEACSLAKSHHNKPQASLSRAQERGEYLHPDLCGPFPIPSIGNTLYYISFVDDATRYTNVQFLKHKSDATPTIIAFIHYRIGDSVSLHNQSVQI
ncbi:hypothetical protein K3495_g7031 [Podosphaera aphanis]|nr:hypothetical protein K3495_g7031 [Podosphaera aphanis]